MEGAKVPAKIFLESRRGVRFSLARRGAILRMPYSLPQQEQKQELTRFEDWVRERVERKDSMQEHFSTRPYQSGDELVVGQRTYPIRIEMTDNKSHSVRLKNEAIHIRLGNEGSVEEREKAIRHLLSRLIAKDFEHKITLRVNELNSRYFQKKINSVNLKYNLSNWGSCSRKGNINLSTCLLFAPEPVIDYVIIHELAHLIEMNHSAEFWKVVQKAMPDYKEKILWLKKNWSKCNF